MWSLECITEIYTMGVYEKVIPTHVSRNSVAQVQLGLESGCFGQVRGLNVFSGSFHAKFNQQETTKEGVDEA